MDIKIHKNSFKSYLKKLKERGIKKVKVFYVYHFSGMTDGIEYINEYEEFDIEKIEEDTKKDIAIYYDREKDRIKIVCFPVFHYDIIDENFNELKRIATIKFIKNEI
jgi:hypothetical protein